MDVLKTIPKPLNEAVYSLKTKYKSLLQEKLPTNKLSMYSSVFFSIYKFLKCPFLTFWSTHCFAILCSSDVYFHDKMTEKKLILKLKRRKLCFGS